MLVPSGAGVISQTRSSAFFDLVSISAHRCSSFFAEAAVLVLVLALLDRFMLKGHLEPRWVIGAVILSLVLLAASIVTDLSARRWLQRH
jgi:general stress protein CsbA